MLRVNQSKLRKEKFVDSPIDSNSSDSSASPLDSLPRERPDVLDDDGAQDHLAPTIYWITPQHVTMDVIELSDGSSTFSSICSQYGLRTGACVSLRGSLLITRKHGTKL